VQSRTSNTPEKIPLTYIGRVYEKPKLVDISKQQEKGFGEVCSYGRGDALCFNGSPAIGCDVICGG